MDPCQTAPVAVHLGAAYRPLYSSMHTHLEQLPWAIAWTSTPSRLCTQSLNQVSSRNLRFSPAAGLPLRGSLAWSLLAAHYPHTQRILCTTMLWFSTTKWFRIEFNKNIEQTAVIRQLTSLLTSGFSRWPLSYALFHLFSHACFLAHLNPSSFALVFSHVKQATPDVFLIASCFVQLPVLTIFTSRKILAHIQQFLKFCSGKDWRVICLHISREKLNWLSLTEFPNKNIEIPFAQVQHEF